MANFFSGNFIAGDVFGSRRCDCGGLLHTALGLPANSHAYKLQEQDLDTVQANEKLGFPD